MLTHGELFAGISGFGLGFERAGIKTIWRVEIDPHCQELLKAKYPDSIVLSDVKECGKHNLPHVDIISFGSPCQDLSVAGKRAGLNGDRSGLFFEAIRIVAELQPAFAVWENVPGAFSSNAGRDFANVLGAFRECGARDIAWRVLDAQHFGVPQRRRRIFLVADFRGERAAEVLFERESGAGDTAESGEARTRVAAPLTRGTSSGRGVNPPGRRQEDDENLVAYTLPASGRHADDGSGNRQVMAFAWQQGDDSKFNEGGKGRSYIARAGDYTGALGETRQDAIAFTQNTRDEVRQINGDGQLVGVLPAQPGMKQQNYLAYPQQFGVRRLTPTECERLQGFPRGWTEGFSDSVRYRMLGNAVAVPCAYWIAKRIPQ